VSLCGSRTYVGFGLGAIQSGLFLYEALGSGNFGRLVVAEVIPETVDCIRANGGYFTINIAHPDGIEAAQIGPIEVINPTEEIDRHKLVGTITTAHEIGTAVPGTQFYTSSGSYSLCHTLAAGLKAKAEKDGPCAVIYTAENHNYAAEILESLTLAYISSAEREIVQRRVCFVNTVIGKMSGIISGRQEIEQLALTPMTPGGNRAILVEVFNRILISPLSFPEGSCKTSFKRGIDAFIEKENLLPFEEAKLYGHNATHALAAYLGKFLGIRRVADVPSIPGLYEFVRRAFIEESGRALIRRYAGIDPLFTTQGYTAYADDLLARMFNPWLADTVERVGRDVTRKLGWEDRLIGTLRLGLVEEVPMFRFALGTAAALICYRPDLLNNTVDPTEILFVLWGNSQRDPSQENAVLNLVRTSLDRLRDWYAANPDDLMSLWALV
jgi:mannitol-1-phosphate/altronate dehydrogenase